MRAGRGGRGRGPGGRGVGGRAAAAPRAAESETWLAVSPPYILPDPKVLQVLLALASPPPAQLPASILRVPEPQIPEKAPGETTPEHTNMRVLQAPRSLRAS